MIFNDGSVKRKMRNGIVQVMLKNGETITSNDRNIKIN